MGNPEKTNEAPKVQLSPEEAQKQVDSAKGNYIELDADISKRLIDRRNEDGGKKFKEWVEKIGKGRDRMQYARQDVFKDIMKYLPKKEQNLIGKNPDKLILTRENWKENLDDLYGIVRKLHVFQNIVVRNKAKDPDGAYLGTLDRAAAVIKGKSLLEAGSFIENYYSARLFLGKYQREGVINQSQVNDYLPLIDKNPVDVINKLNEARSKKEESERASAEEDLETDVRHLPSEKVIWKPSADRALRAR